MEDEEEAEGGELDKHTPGYLTELWRDKAGDIHRLNGPAIIFSNGDTIWYRHGKRHRDDGPAAIYQDEDTLWYRHGKLHREDGPARVWPRYKLEEWYKDGKVYEPSAHELMTWKMKKKE